MHTLRIIVCNVLSHNRHLRKCNIKHMMKFYRSADHVICLAISGFRLYLYTNMLTPLRTQLENCRRSSLWYLARFAYWSLIVLVSFLFKVRAGMIFWIIKSNIIGESLWLNIPINTLESLFFCDWWKSHIRSSVVSVSQCIVLIIILRNKSYFALDITCVCSAPKTFYYSSHDPSQ